MNSIKPEITKDSFRYHCQNNENFAVGVLEGLLHTPFCIHKPDKYNKYSKMAFKFPLDVREEFLECILDCVELLSEAPAALSVLNDEDADGYVLAIKSGYLVNKVININNNNPWCFAGILFTQFNKNKTNTNEISIIDSKVFGKNTFTAVDKLNYLLLL